MRRKWPAISAIVFLMAFLFTGCGSCPKCKTKGPSASSKSEKNRNERDNDQALDDLQDAIDDLKDAQDEALKKALRDALAAKNDPGLGLGLSPTAVPTVVPPGAITTPVPPVRPPFRPGGEDPTAPPRPRVADRSFANAFRSELEIATHGEGERGVSSTRRRAE